MDPKDLKYTKTHEWIRVEGNRGTVGLTNYAQDHLGDIVFVELPEEDDEFAKGDSFAVVESVKAASDCYLPVGGKVVETNPKLADEPGVMNQDCYGEGWMVVIEISDPSELDELMDIDAYTKYQKEEAEH